MKSAPIVNRQPQKATGVRLARRVAVAVAIALAAISVYLNVALGRAALRYYDAGEALRLDPAGLKAFAGDREKPAPIEPLVVFFGDSRAFMWSAPTAPTGYRIVNRGISWQTTAQMLLRFDADVLSLHPQAVVIEAGINDLKMIARFPERRAEIVADCKANLERLVDRSVGIPATVVLVTVFDIGDVSLWRRPFWSDDVASAVHDVNAFLAKLARSNVIVFDANAVLEGSRGEIARGYELDYLHLSPSGYSALNSRLVPLLLTLHK
ncbi:MAG TPA: GDSL-type esterase/lipase family protein [Polyangiaceae bacterium]|nr:GDSL-type esterase/lipase family protein [Polyangiaceae bacterium]